jgi:hypothetical protein
MNSRRLYVVGVALLGFLVPQVVLAQDPGSGAPPSTQQDPTTQQGSGAPQSPAGQQPSTDNGQKPAAQDDSASPPIAPAQVLDTTPVVREVGKAEQLGQVVSPLRWGPIYIGSAEALAAYENVSATDSTLSTSSPLGILSTTVVFDKESEQNRFAIQYNPSILFASGQVYSNLTSQQASFNTVKSLTPRLSFTFADTFSAIRQVNLLVDSYFSLDSISHTALQGQFLNNPGLSIRNGALLGATYLLSPQSSLSVSGTYTYADTTATSNSTSGGSGVITTANPATVANQVGASFALSRAFNEGTTAGLTYAFQDVHISGQEDLYYHNFGVNFSKAITPNFSVGGAGLASVTVPSGSVGSGQGQQQLTWMANAQAVRTFNENRSSLALVYTRTEGITQVITSQYYDRVDATYNMRWSARFSSSVGGGYFRTVAGSSPTVPNTEQQQYTATYVRANLEYSLTPSVHLVANFAHQLQTGNSTQVLAGTSNLVLAGIRWAPSAVH